MTARPTRSRSRALPFLAGMVAAAFPLWSAAAPQGAGSRSLPQGEDEPPASTRIAALEQRMAAQDRRIEELERLVKMLMAGSHSASDSASGVAAPAAPAVSSAPSSAAVRAVVEHPAAAPVARPTAESGAGRQLKVGGVNVNGDVYLFQYVPTGVEGSQPRFELYAFSVQLDGQHGNWGFHSDYRLRTTKLRSFFPGNTWLQQGSVRYRTRYGEFQAGSFYRRVGLVWDASFFGNIQYFDGLKLDPEFGIGFEGAHTLSGKLGAEYSTQYFTTDARINGSLPGRDFVSEPGARAKNDFTARFAPVWHFSSERSLAVGGSFAQGTISRDGAPSNGRRQFAADATLAIGPWLTYGEALRQTLSAQVTAPPQDATYLLLGTRWTRGRYQPRINFSQANYHGPNGRREYIVQPGINVELAEGFSFIYEYDFWRDITPLQRQTVDRSLNFVLLYHF